MVVSAGEEHANAEPLCDAEEGDAIELKGDKLEVEEPNDRGLGAAAKILVLGATTTVTMPACAAAVSSMSEPPCRNRSPLPSMIMCWMGWPDGGDMSTLLLNSVFGSLGDCASELCESSSMVM